MAVRFVGRAVFRTIAARSARGAAAGRSRESFLADVGFDEDSFLSGELERAFITMESMVANNGQQAVYERYIVPAFYESFQSSTTFDGWEEVDIGEYMAFVGIIVGEGNQIMTDAYNFVEDALA